ncbi:MAG: DUF1080 domain-containing protein [Vicinamibacterales bacterium]
MSLRSNLTRRVAAAVLVLAGGGLVSSPVFMQGGAPAAGAAPATPAAGQGGGGRGGGGGVSFLPPSTKTPYDDYTGFTRIFDGTLTNWVGETDVWSIENGLLHADTTKTPGQHHIHYVGTGAVMRDFTLKVEAKLSAAGANGGVQYRSRLLHPAYGGSLKKPLGRPLPAKITTMDQAVAAGITAAPAARGGGAGGAGRGGATPGAPAPAAAGAPAVPAAGAGRAAGGAPADRGRGPAPGAAPAASASPCVGEVGNLSAAAAPAGRGGAPAGPATGNPWQVSGYQFDMDSANQYTGQLYEGQGRNIITAPGTIGMLLPGGCKILLGTISADPKAAVKPHRGLDGDWQQIEIIARGNTLVHMINGQVMSVTIDDDPVARASQGILSLQLEGNGQIWYRNVYLKVIAKPLDFPK